MQDDSVRNMLVALRGPKPRAIPEDFHYSDPLAKLFIILGSILTSMMIAMTILFVILNHFGLMHTRGLGGADVNPIFLFFPLIFTIVPLSMLIKGLKRSKLNKKYFVNGDLVKGKVLEVKPLSMRMNDRTFFKIKVQFNAASHNLNIRQSDANGDTVVTDIVDNYAMEYFLTARDNQTMIDLLFLPQHPKQAFLIHKLTTSRKRMSLKLFRML